MGRLASAPVHGRTAISSPWQPILLSVLEAWHEDPEAATDRAPREASDMARKAAGLEPDQRPAFLAALRHRLEFIPLDRVHPTWITAALPSDPLLRLWALDALPRPLRRRVLDELPEGPLDVRLLSATPPSWFARWWQSELRATIDYPAPIPGAVDKTEVVRYLDLFEPAEIESVLEWWGLRPLAAALRGLEEAQVVALVLALPAHLRQRLTEVSSRGELPASPPWHLRFAKLAAGRPDRSVERLAVLLALEDVSAQAGTTACADGVVRLAYRLPMDLGRRALRRLEAGAGDLAAEDPEAWHRRFAADLDELVRSGRVTPLEPGEEVWR